MKETLINAVNPLFFGCIGKQDTFLDEEKSFRQKSTELNIFRQ